MSTHARWRENAASPIAATNRAEMVGGGIAGGVTRVGSTLSYLAVDGLGSVSEALDTSGNVTAQQLYAPYGSVRYSVGTLPTTTGYTGQRQDVSSGLDYDVARYYDSSTEQFASADTASDPGNGLDRLAYVGGNPETLTDPTGHVRCDSEDTSNCGGGGSSGQVPNTNASTGVTLNPSAAAGYAVAAYSTGCNCSVGATVGPPKVTSSTDPNAPDVLQWGNKDNGVIGFEFYGASLQALYNLDKAALRDWNTGRRFWAQRLSQLVLGIAGAFLGWGGAAIAAIADTLIEFYANMSKQELQDGMDALKTVMDAGGKAIYLISIFQGTGDYGQTVGGADFYTDIRSAMFGVGELMQQDCISYYLQNPPPTFTPSSPGLQPGQDSNWQAPPPAIAGCTGH